MTLTPEELRIISESVESQRPLIEEIADLKDKLKIAEEALEYVVAESNIYTTQEANRCTGALLKIRGEPE